ncbi:ftsH [Symbiodinium natans]|uniref:FtsH protein n=1 Tax=Symbiodinium natans TaxID=878477 RepID=A0A812PVJ4_9DINO|nr:ftsH [Symbiodinium natans]
MAVVSKMASAKSSRAPAVVAGAAALLLAPTFLAPQAPRQVEVHQSRAATTGNVARSGAAETLTSVGAASAAALAGAAVATGSSRKLTSRGALARSSKSQQNDKEFQRRISHLISVAQVLLQRPGPDQLQHLVHELQSFAAAELRRSVTLSASVASAFADVVASAEEATRSSAEGQLRWAASAAASLLLTFAVTLQPANAADVVNYSDFLDSVKKGDVEMVRVQNDMLSAQYTTKDGARRDVNLIPNAQIEDELFNTLADKKVDVVMQNANAGGSPFDFLARFAGPIAWLIAGLLLLFGGLPFGGPAGPGGPGGNPFELGKSKARIIKDGDTKVKFGDVAGCDGAKQELVEVVDFLKNTSRYSELGAKIPKGALLVGPPGTGKTLLAKAVAGEAGVPFFSISASEFVEIFAGIGASRVRDLFEQAKKSAPCIIFIDEIDAVGRQRSAGFGQGNDEREQTVNQLLTEMDGFESNKGVVVIAATNRADILDQALVRPGRFDRQIQVDPPDVQGRTEILKVHAKDKNLAPGVDLSAVARQTPGMSGADLANLLNEGAIQAARSNKAEIDADDIFNALERISIGLEKKDAVMSDQKKKLVAYHEAGHAILGALMNDYDVVAKISIVPRGPAGGVTIFMPSEDRLNSGLYSKEFLENRMCVALGGRLAEEIINGRDNVTTGASNDFQQCTQVAKTMVMQLGMSPEIGQRLLGGQQQGGPFMGRDFMGQGAPPMSQALKKTVDSEVKRIVDEQYQRGMKLLRDNMYLLDTLAKTLMEEEKVSGDQLMKMINQAAAEGKLVMGNSKMAMAAYAGEKVEATADGTLAKKAKCVHPDKPMMFACADCPRRGFCGSTRAAPRDGRASRSAVARLGLASEEVEAKECTSEEVMRRVQDMALDISNGEALPNQVVRAAAAQVLAALAVTAAPMAAQADDVPALQPFGAPQVQQQPGGAVRVSGRVTYSRLLEFVDEGSVKRVDFYDLGRTAVALVNVAGREQQLVCDLPGATTGLIEKLVSKNIAIEVHQPEKPNPLLNVLGDVAFPLLLIAGLLFLRSRTPGGGGIPGFGNQGRAKIMITPETGVKFQDVAGIDEAKEELMEIVDFLKAPERFVKVGAKIPRGVLLTGPPGTGKTLMAKALAGESGVPFIQSSASEFIELFVGVGASRVRDIFKQAKEKAPCIVFIDEIDAIGRQRGAGMGGGNDEREQTLNQILTEMDGFEGNSGVIVVAATNRSDILDNALLRPGRFDRRVQVGLPDVKGREQILNVHIRNKKLAEEITLTDIAKRTAGFSGADLENLMNESAILAARRNKKAISMDEINDATDRVIAGLEGRALQDNAAKKLIAYHEAGHAIVGTLLPYHDPVNKVTLIPRGQAKGLTWFTPNEDQSLISAAMLKARIAGALGGRAAEQLVFGTSQVTTGAGGDLQQVERMARSMVTQFGMSEVGSLAIDDGGFMGPEYSEDLSRKIDDAIKAISDECYLNALTILMKNRACLDRVADELTELETITGDRLRELVAEYAEIPEKLAAV